MRTCIILLFFLSKTFSLISNMFRHWTCLGIQNTMDFSRPFSINVGDLPLVLWKNHNTGKIQSTVNICKHMGSRLDNGIITDTGCLKCKYHGLEFSGKDNFGEIAEHEGKIFWAYEPIEKIPHKIPFFNNKDYIHSFLQIDMEGSLVDSALNSVDLRHPEFVHNLGFGNSIPPTDIHQYLYKDLTGSPTRVGLAFKYESNKLMRKFNDNTKSTQNFHMFVYPTYTWSRVSFDNKHLIVAVNMLPLEKKKTRWFVTLCHNYYQSNIQKNFMKMLASTILSQDYVQMQYQAPENVLKKSIMFEHVFNDEEVILWLYKIFENYKYPDIEICADLYKLHRQNIGTPPF